MHYFAKLVLGLTYRVHGKIFERDVEQPVTEDIAKYLETVVEERVVNEGSKAAIRPIPRFEIRTEEFTTQEKVEVEIAGAPESLKPKKPGPKPAA